MSVKLRDFIDEGACTQIGFEIFFGGPNDGPRAKNVCNTMCSVKEDCLDYALEVVQDAGIWGGTDSHERQKMRRDRGMEE